MMWNDALQGADTDRDGRMSHNEWILALIKKGLLVPWKPQDDYVKKWRNKGASKKYDKYAEDSEYTDKDDEYSEYSNYEYSERDKRKTRTTGEDKDDEYSNYSHYNYRREMKHINKDINTVKNYN